MIIENGLNMHSAHILIESAHESSSRPQFKVNLVQVTPMRKASSQRSLSISILNSLRKYILLRQAEKPD